MAKATAASMASCSSASMASHVLLGQHTIRDELRGIGLDGIPSPPGVLLLLRPVVAGEGLLALVVTVPPVGPGLDQRRATSGPSLDDGAFDRLPHGEHVVAVHLFTRNAHRLPTIGDATGGQLLRRRPLRVAVVLADEDDGQLPDLSEVHGLEEDTLVRGSVAEEDDRHVVAAQLLVAPRRSGADRDAAPDDAVGADDPEAEVDRCASSRLCLGSSRRPCRRARPSSGRPAHPWRSRGHGPGASR